MSTPPRLHRSGSRFSYAGDELDAMACAENYYRWILERIRPYLGSRVMEVGAGIGTFSEFLAGALAGAELILLEPAENNLALLQDRMGSRPGVTVIEGVLDQTTPSSAYDTLVAVNVLEHISDDRDFVRQAVRVLAPGGRLILFVPAGPGLFGTLDEAFEHHRRYTREGLAHLLTGAGFEGELLRYANLPGVLAWWASGRILRKRTLRPGAVRLYDRWAIPVIRAVEELVPPPVGQSLFAVARRPQSPR